MISFLNPEKVPHFLQICQKLVKLSKCCAFKRYFCHIQQNMKNNTKTKKLLTQGSSLDKQYYDQMEFVIDVGRTRTNHNKVIIID